jgi:hypothetical protein
MLDRHLAAVLRASVLRDDARPAVAGALDVARDRLGERGLVGLADVAETHGVAGYLHARTEGLHGLPASEAQRLATVRGWIARWHLRSIADLHLLRRTFEAAGVDWLAVKGPVLAVPVHGAPDLRSYGDLDVLVPGDHLGRALAALEGIGAEVLDRNWVLLSRELKGEVHLQLPSGTVVDLHWHLLNERENRDRFPIDIGDVFRRSRSVAINRLEVPTLSPADTLVYVALHAVVSGADRLIWLKDIERLVALEPSTTEVLRSAVAWRTETVLGLALDLVAGTLGSDPHLERLRSRLPTRIWHRGCRRAARFSPPERQDGSGSLHRALVRATGHRTSDGLGRLARRGLLHLRQDRSDRSTDGLLPADHPGSSRFDAGGPDGRRAYLELVARQG